MKKFRLFMILQFVTMFFFFKYEHVCFRPVSNLLHYREYRIEIQIPIHLMGGVCESFK